MTENIYSTRGVPKTWTIDKIPKNWNNMTSVQRAKFAARMGDSVVTTDCLSKSNLPIQTANTILARALLNEAEGISRLRLGIFFAKLNPITRALLQALTQDESSLRNRAHTLLSI